MYYEKNGIKIYYNKYGMSKKNLIILPGWGDTRNTFLNIINTYKEYFTIYIIDYPSFGKSPTPTKELTIYDYALLIRNFIKDNNINNPSVIAHSFGGRITSLLVGKYKLKLDKIILIDVAGIKRRKKLKVFLKEKVYKILKILTRLLPKKKQELVRKKLLLRFSSDDYQAIPISMKKTFQNIIKVDLRDYYKEIMNETLIIWGQYDCDTPLKDGRYLNKIISNSALITYKGAGHFSYLNYPYLTNKIIYNFLIKES